MLYCWRWARLLVRVKGPIHSNWFLKSYLLYFNSLSISGPLLCSSAHLWRCVNEKQDWKPLVVVDSVIGSEVFILWLVIHPLFFFFWLRFQCSSVLSLSHVHTFWGITLLSVIWFRVKGLKQNDFSFQVSILSVGFESLSRPWYGSLSGSRQRACNIYVYLDKSSSHP